MPLTPDEIKQRHVELHRSFDELFACFITEHPDKTNFLETPLKEFMDWSYQMTLNPTCTEKHAKEDGK